MKKEAYQKKVNNIMKYGNLAVFIILSIIAIVIKGNIEFIVVAGAIVFLSFFMSGIFRYAVNTESYDLISGVNTKKFEYDEDILKKVMLIDEFIFVFNGLIISSIIMILSLLDIVLKKQSEMFIAVCVAVYVIGIVVPILVVGKKIKPIKKRN